MERWEEGNQNRAEGEEVEPGDYSDKQEDVGIMDSLSMQQRGGRA